MSAQIEEHSAIEIVLRFQYTKTCEGVGKTVIDRACLTVDGSLYARCPDCIRLQPARRIHEDETPE
jgi:hypothetical protein